MRDIIVTQPTNGWFIDWTASKVDPATKVDTSQNQTKYGVLQRQSLCGPSSICAWNSQTEQCGCALDDARLYYDGLRSACEFTCTTGGANGVPLYVDGQNLKVFFQNHATETNVPESIVRSFVAPFPDWINEQTLVATGRGGACPGA